MGMKNLTLGFSEAIGWLTRSTYLSDDDAATLLKYKYHEHKFKQQIGRLPTKEECLKMMEALRKDYSLAYMDMQFSTEELHKLIKATMSNNPFIRPE